MVKYEETAWTNKRRPSEFLKRNYSGNAISKRRKANLLTLVIVMRVLLIVAWRAHEYHIGLGSCTLN